MHGGLALAALAVVKGARILRVHDVAETIQRQTYHALARNPNQQRATKGMQGFHMLEQA